MLCCVCVYACVVGWLMMLCLRVCCVCVCGCGWMLVSVCVLVGWLCKLLLLLVDDVVL